jgi:hypothetical protein
MPVKDIIEFIIYITPGFLALEIYNSAHPVRDRKEFTDIAWSVIYGVLIYSFAEWLNNVILNDYFNSSRTVFPNLSFIIYILIIGVIVGLLKIFIHFIRDQISIRYPKLKFFAPDPQSIWVKINSPVNKCWAVVYTEDNAVYLGWISEYTSNPHIENQDFLLSKAKRVDDKLNVIYPINGIGVYLNTKNIKRIEFLKGK